MIEPKNRPMPSQTADRDTIARIRDFIQTAHTLTLATAHGSPWAAPVFYVAAGLRFYFFSSPDSRHVQDAMDAGNAAAAIYREGASWRDLQGLQLIGAVLPVDNALETAKALTRYVQKFPLINTFFPGQGILNIRDINERFRARLYRFQAERIWYMDNGKGFGYRVEAPALEIAGEFP